MVSYLKILGLLLLIISIAAAAIMFSSLDPRSVHSSNDFVNALLHSEDVYQASFKIRLALSGFVALLGITVASICLAISQILSRLATIEPGN
jgi:hypothetical protein